MMFQTIVPNNGLKGDNPDVPSNWPRGRQAENNSLKRLGRDPGKSKLETSISFRSMQEDGKQLLSELWRQDPGPAVRRPSTPPPPPAPLCHQPPPPCHGHLEFMLQPHGCWQTFYVFAYCGLVGNPHFTAEIYSLLPFQCQPR